MPSARKERTEPGPKGRRWGSRWKATGAPRRLRRRSEGATGAVRPGISSKATVWSPRVRVTRRARTCVPGASRGDDRRPLASEVPAPGLALDVAGEGEAHDEAAGEGDVPARFVHLEGRELDVGLLPLPLERGLVDEGLGRGEETRIGVTPESASLARPPAPGGPDRDRRGAVGPVARGHGDGPSGEGDREAGEGDEVARLHGDELHPAAHDGIRPEPSGGNRGEAGLGVVEEAGDEELRRAVFLLLGVEAPGHELEGHPGGCPLEDAQRLLRRVPVRLPLRRGLRRLPRRRRRLGGALALRPARRAPPPASRRRGRGR